ncbi:hypothetical protein SBA4_1390020 [Candidatus Sulfopaludibacter sp. SbA4]|nr:hypothetical protein SBA4_1390020 [Candidatus Sulfopaludibacter sp. SbA4]
MPERTIPGGWRPVRGKCHDHPIDTREVPAYALTVADGGPKMQPYLGDCVDLSVLPPLPPGQKYCGFGGSKEANFSPRFAPDTAVKDLDGFSLRLFAMTDRPVLNKTGIPGRFFIDFVFAPDRDTPGALARLPAWLAGMAETLELQPRPRIHPDRRSSQPYSNGLG